MIFILLNQAKICIVNCKAVALSLPNRFQEPIYILLFPLTSYHILYHFHFVCSCLLRIITGYPVRVVYWFFSRTSNLSKPKNKRHTHTLIIYLAFSALFLSHFSLSLSHYHSTILSFCFKFSMLATDPNQLAIQYY